MLSIVIPVYDEAESLEILHRELVEVAEAEGYELDMIFVDDGSTDESWAVIQVDWRPATPGCGDCDSAAILARRPL